MLLDSATGSAASIKPVYVQSRECAGTCATDAAISATAHIPPCPTARATVTGSQAIGMELLQIPGSWRGESRAAEAGFMSLLQPLNVALLGYGRGQPRKVTVAEVAQGRRALWHVS
jgi:hypothetical protein